MARQSYANESTWIYNLQRRLGSGVYFWPTLFSKCFWLLLSLGSLLGMVFLRYQSTHEHMLFDRLHRQHALLHRKWVGLQIQRDNLLDPSLLQKVTGNHGFLYSKDTKVRFLKLTR